jgi:hypothetical protein
MCCSGTHRPRAEFQYASDLHLEFYETTKTPYETFLTPVAPILVLTGDIGYPESFYTFSFFLWCSKRWKHVLWVFGNHEYYTCYPMKSWPQRKHEDLPTMNELESKARHLYSAFANVHILQGDTIDLEGVRFFGATMWTHVEPEYHTRIGGEGLLTDFTAIVERRADPGKKPMPFSLAHRNMLHAQHKAALQAAATKARADGVPLVVITHHPPLRIFSETSHTPREALNPYYVNDFEAFIGGLPKVPVAWICGHSHGVRTVRKPCLCCLNARGYPKQQNIRNLYNPIASLTVPPLSESDCVCDSEDEASLIGSTSVVGEEKMSALRV